MVSTLLLKTYANNNYSPNLFIRYYIEMSPEILNYLIIEYNTQAKDID
jgi:hypothetical protein